MGWGIDHAAEKQPENVIPRLKAMLGDAVKFELEWVSIYTFQGRRMESFRHHRVIFAGDSAHQVSPFGARGANSGVQDTNNLGWKLKAVINGIVSDALIDSYNIERVCAAEENIRHSTQSTNFITPKLAASRIFRDAVLNLAEQYPFAQPLVNSGRLSLPCVYDHSPLTHQMPFTDPAAAGPARPAAMLPCKTVTCSSNLGVGLLCCGSILRHPTLSKTSFRQLAWWPYAPAMIPAGLYKTAIWAQQTGPCI